MTQFLHAFMSIIYLYIYYYLKTTPPNKRRRPVGRAAPVIIISRLRPVRISKRAPGYKRPVIAWLLSTAQVFTLAKKGAGLPHALLGSMVVLVFCRCDVAGFVVVVHGFRFGLG